MESVIKQKSILGNFFKQKTEAKTNSYQKIDFPILAFIEGEKSTSFEPKFKIN